MTIGIRYATRSDAGMLRETNEDSAYAGSRLLAVADGMGGHSGGELASATAIDAMKRLDLDIPADDLLAVLQEAVRQANEAVYGLAESDPSLKGMGTTLTAMLLSGQKLALVQIGDSRAYLLRDGELFQITHDQTLVPLCPLTEPITNPQQIARLDVRRRRRLGGILHEYTHAA
jgi:protein phosphatase